MADEAETEPIGRPPRVGFGSRVFHFLLGLVVLSMAGGVLMIAWREFTSGPVWGTLLAVGILVLLLYGARFPLGEAFSGLGGAEVKQRRAPTLDDRLRGLAGWLFFGIFALVGSATIWLNVLQLWFESGHGLGQGQDASDPWLAFFTSLPFVVVGFGGLSWLALQRQQVSQEAPLNDLDSGHFQALKLSQPRWWLVLERFGVAIVWNSMNAVGVVVWLRGEVEVEYGFVSLLVVLLFLVMGAGLLWWAVENSKGLFNPRLDLELKCTRLQPGATFVLRWQQPASKGIETLGIALVGHEESEDGVDTPTVTHEFHRKQLLQNTRLKAGSDARELQVKFPQNVMHSFQSDNHRVVWFLEVAITMVSGKQSRDRYGLEIAPIAMDARHG